MLFFFFVYEWLACLLSSMSSAQYWALFSIVWSWCFAIQVCRVFANLMFNLDSFFWLMFSHRIQCALLMKAFICYLWNKTMIIKIAYHSQYLITERKKLIQFYSFNQTLTFCLTTGEYSFYEIQLLHIPNLGPNYWHWHQQNFLDHGKKTEREREKEASCHVILIEYIAVTIEKITINQIS